MPIAGSVSPFSSAKQCGRATVPEVSSAAPFDALFERTDHDVLVLAEPGAWPDATPVGLAASRRQKPRRRRQCGAGGWMGSGRNRPRQRSRGAWVTLGALTLRADAAAVVSLPVLRYVWERSESVTVCSLRSTVYDRTDYGLGLRGSLQLR